MFCRHCETELEAVQPYCPCCNASTSDVIPRLPVSKRSRFLYVVLTWLFGLLGIHRLYLDQEMSFLRRFMLAAFAAMVWTLDMDGSYNLMWFWVVPLAILTIWVLIDLIQGVMGYARDGNWSPVIRWWKEEPTKGGIWSIGRVFWLLGRTAILTVILFTGLFFAGSAIASSVLPQDINYVPNGRCDIGNEPARYILVKDGQTVGEFCFKHAVLYDMAGGVRLENLKTQITESPNSIRLLSRWSFGIVAALIAFPVALWWEARKDWYRSPQIQML